MRNYRTHREHKCNRVCNDRYEFDEERKNAIVENAVKNAEEARQRQIMRLMPREEFFFDRMAYPSVFSTYSTSDRKERIEKYVEDNEAKICVVKYYDYNGAGYRNELKMVCVIDQSFDGKLYYYPLQAYHGTKVFELPISDLVSIRPIDNVI